MRLSSKLFSSVNTRSLVLGTGIGLACLAFVFTGIGPTGGGLEDSVAAKVGSQTVTMRQLSEVVSQLDSRSGGDEARRKANIQNGLNQIIQERVLVEEATRLGWNANDLEVADWIRKIPSFQNKETKQFDRSVYQRFLKSGQITELELFRQGRDSLATRKLYVALGLPDHTPKSLLESELARNQVTFDLEFAEVAASEGAIKAATGEEAKKFAADPANEKRLKDAYDGSKAEFVRKAQVHVRSILVAHKAATRAQGEALNRTEEQAASLAGDLLGKIKGGEDFAKVAATTNDDPAAKAARGDLGWVDDTTLDPDSVKAAFTLTKTAPYSEVIKTPFGYRILQWVEARAALEKSFADVKEELALRLVGMGARARLTTELEKEVNAALSSKDAAKLDAQLKKNGLSWKKIPKPVSVSTRFVEELGLSEPLMPHLFGMKKPGDTVPVVLDFSGRRAVFKLVARHDAPLVATDAAAKQKALEELARSNSYRFAQTYVAQSQRKLIDLYTKDKEIKRNETLLQ